MYGDHRDTNHDGKVSLMEKVKDKLHLGHKDTATTHTTSSSAHHTALPATHTSALPATSAAIPTAGVLPMNGVAAMPIAAVPATGIAALPTTGAYTTGALDSRDLNRDGHVSMGEKLATSGSHSGSAFTSGAALDSRDLNRDGHISTAERLATGSRFAGESEEQMRLRLHEEQLAISKREVGAGEVDIHKSVHEQHVQQTIPVRREEVIVERHALSGIAEPGARIAPQDETMRVPLFREEILTEKRVVPTEEVIVRKKEVIEQQTVGATLRSEHVEAIQTGTHISSGIATGGMLHDSRDLNRDGHVSMGEKLQSGALNSHTGAYGDSRDLNRDGHVSMGEKLQSGALGSRPATGAFDARDSNLDGHVSMGEKLKGTALGTAPRAARG